MDRLVFVDDPLLQIVASLYDDGPLAELKVLPEDASAKPQLLQEFLLHARTLGELDDEMKNVAVYSSGNITGLELGHYTLKSPDTFRLRSELEKLLWTNPEFVGKYDAYTWDNPRLWQGFVDLYWNAQDATTIGSLHKPSPDLAYKVQKFSNAGIFHGLDASFELQSLANKHLSLASDYEMIRATTPFNPLSKDHRYKTKRMNVLTSEVKNNALLIQDAISRLGHEYRREYLSQL